MEDEEFGKLGRIERREYLAAGVSEGVIDYLDSVSDNKIRRRFLDKFVEIYKKDMGRDVNIMGIPYQRKVINKEKCLHLPPTEGQMKVLNLIWGRKYNPEYAPVILIKAQNLNRLTAHNEIMDEVNINFEFLKNGNLKGISKGSYNPWVCLDDGDFNEYELDATCGEVIL